MVLPDKHKKAATKKWKARNGVPTTSAAPKSPAVRYHGPPGPVHVAAVEEEKDEDESEDEDGSEGSDEPKEDGAAEGEAAGEPSQRRRRPLGTNASRYDEPEPEEDAEPEPEIDLSAFLERQRLAGPEAAAVDSSEPPEDDVDKSLSHLRRGALPAPKGRAFVREQDTTDHAQMALDRAKADAASEVKARLRGGGGMDMPYRPPPRRAPVETPSHAKRKEDDIDDFLNDLM